MKVVRHFFFIVISHDIFEFNLLKKMSGNGPDKFRLFNIQFRVGPDKVQFLLFIDLIFILFQENFDFQHKFFMVFDFDFIIDLKFAKNDRIFNTDDKFH